MRISQLNAHNVSYKFANDRMVKLPEISQHFSNMLCIKGRTGSGKSLLLKSLGGAVIPATGEVSVTHFATPLVVDGYYVHSQPEFNFVTGVIGDELEFAGVAPDNYRAYLKRNVNELSGGELKKISVMMAMESADGVVLLDEPLDMLDDEQTVAMAEYIAHASKRTPVIIATHRDDFDVYTDNIIRIDRSLPAVPAGPVKSDNIGSKVFVKTEALSVNLNGRIFAPVDLALHSGEIVCIYGRNGSGKTLFTRTIAGIGKYGFSGSCEWFVDVAERGICLQFPEQMAYQESISREIADSAGSQNTDRILEALGWQSRRDSSPFALSDGEKRIMYVVSHLMSGKACLFDEPFGGLDQESINSVVNMMYTARSGGAGIIYTTNRRSEAVYADTVINIQSGS